MGFPWRVPLHPHRSGISRACSTWDLMGGDAPLCAFQSVWRSQTSRLTYWGRIGAGTFGCSGQTWMKGGQTWMKGGPLARCFVALLEGRNQCHYFNFQYKQSWKTCLSVCFPTKPGSWRGQRIFLDEEPVVRQRAEGIAHFRCGRCLRHQKMLPSSRLYCEN